MAFKNLKWEDRLYLLATVPDGQVARGLLEGFEFEYTQTNLERDEFNNRMLRGLPLRVPRLNLTRASIQRAVDTQPSLSHAIAVNFLLQVGNSHTASRRARRILQYLSNSNQKWVRNRSAERTAYGMMPGAPEIYDRPFLEYGGVARISVDRMMMVDFSRTLHVNWLTLNHIFDQDRYQYLPKRHASSREHVTYRLGKAMWRLFGDDLGAWDLAWELMRFTDTPIGEALETTHSAIEGKRTLPDKKLRVTPWLFRTPVAVTFDGVEVFGPQNVWNVASLKRHAPGR